MNSFLSHTKHLDECPLSPSRLAHIILNDQDWITHQFLSASQLLFKGMCSLSGTHALLESFLAERDQVDELCILWLHWGSHPVTLCIYFLNTVFFTKAAVTEDVLHSEYQWMQPFQAGQGIFHLTMFRQGTHLQQSQTYSAYSIVLDGRKCRK